MIVKLTLDVGAGADLGGFDLYSNSTGSFVKFSVSPITRQQLLNGYSTSLVPTGTTIVRITSLGSCTNSYDSTVALIPVSGEYIIIGDSNNVSVSDDFGISFNTQLLFPSGTNLGNGLDINRDGKYMTIAFYGDKIFTSNNYGLNWTQRNYTENWRDVSVSDNGKYQVAISDAGAYVSDDFGVTWTNRLSTPNPWSVGMNNSGSEMFVSVNGYSEGIYKSIDYGLTWSKLYTLNYTNDIAVSKNNSKYIIVIVSNSIYRSDDFGVSFTQMLLGTYGSFNDVSMSNDGKYQLLVTNSIGSGIIVSSDYGVTWNSISGSASNNYNGSFVTETGETMATITSANQYFISLNFGATWNASAGGSIGTSISVNK